MSGRKYHSAVQASASYDTPAEAAISVNPMFVASAMIISTAGLADVGPDSNHASGVRPNAGSTTSIPSSSVRRAASSSCGASNVQVSRRARSRAAATCSSSSTTPGRATRSEIKYSHTDPSSTFGESCSIARAMRNSSSCFHSGAPTNRHPA